jgi:hypothetical protein
MCFEDLRLPEKSNNVTVPVEAVGASIDLIDRFQVDAPIVRVYSLKALIEAMRVPIEIVRVPIEANYR